MIWSLRDIENQLNYWLESPPYYLPEFKMYLQILLATGCRPSEPFDKNDWSIDTFGRVILSPKKGNNDRNFNKEDLPALFINRLENDLPLFVYYRISAFVYYCSHTFLFPRPTSGNKKTVLYLFRYFKVKSMVADGFTENEIKNYFGWSDVAMVVRYNNSIIYSSL